MTAAHLHQLALGRRLHSRIQYVEAFSSFFGARVTSLSGEDLAKQIDGQTTGASVWRDEEDRCIAERAVALSPRDRPVITTLIESLRAYDVQSCDRRQRRKSHPGDCT